MELQHLTSIVEAFKSKVGNESDLLYDHPVISGNYGVRHGGLTIFDGAGPDASKIASLRYDGNGKIFTATLIVGLDEYSFVENYQLCLELIDRLVMKAKKIVEIYESAQLNKHDVSVRSKQLFCEKCGGKKLVPFEKENACWDCGHYQAK